MKNKTMKNKNLLMMFALCASIATVSCAGSGNNNNQQQAAETVTTDDVNGYPEIKFDTAVYNFGKILQGEQTSYDFKFRNTGNKNLIIQKVETSCGCTVPEYDRSPVSPNGTGSIRVRFDSNGKSGTQYKTIKVTTNCKDNIFDLVITGEVVVK